MLSLRYPSYMISPSLDSFHLSGSCSSRNVIVCELKGPRPRYPRVWKSRKKIGTISKSKKLVDCVKELSNVKEEVYGALDAFIAWDLEFPLITVKKALKVLEDEKEWKRIIQVTKWMLSKGQGRTMGSYYTLLNALGEEDRLEEAEDLWTRLFSENLESTPRMFFDKMISIYYSRDIHDKMFDSHLHATILFFRCFHNGMSVVSVRGFISCFMDPSQLLAPVEAVTSVYELGASMSSTLSANSFC
ncbi:pentatricopeptide repeat-containing protein At4g21190 isoform X2 [Amaranthus tricolor]|uniref:pentatricopeptide repeat-containing protein At4g21190 isoform X2 n=1 Tax=Amaranthus tricolor TaxID=29722 RepID=UPI00258295BA|nr:pentatricopeptide repeat-containing protein At4g21190 isoform X2 [Amaranthus tricolor]